MDVHKSLNLEIFNNLQNYSDPISIPNVINWDVFDFSDAKFGVVTDMLLDKNGNEPRHIVIKTVSPIESNENNYVLIPVGMIGINENNKYIKIEYMEREILDDAPKFNGKEISNDYEKRATSFFSDYITNSTHKVGVLDVFKNTSFASDKGRQDSGLSINTEPSSR